MDRLSLGIVHQPIFVIGINRRALGDLEWRSPDPRGEAESTDLVFEFLHPMREFVGDRRSIVAARVLIAFVDMKEVESVISQVCGEELRVGESCAFRYTEVVSRPAPPADGRGCARS